MTRNVSLVACLALLAAFALAGPQADKTKKAASAKAQCPHAAAQCADCPDATAKSDCTDCPGAAAKCPGMARAAQSGGKLATMKCGEGTKTINIAKLTAEKKYVDYMGKRYYFACPSCSTAFKKDPEGYTARHTGFPIPKAAKRTSSAR
jgi:YHS domain-containing protein